MNRQRLPLQTGAALALLTLGLGTTGPAGAQQAGKPGAIQVVAQPSDSPLVSIRLMFDVGSIHDPKGKEGLAALTALMIGQASTQKRSYAQFLEALYPMAAEVEADIDREVTVFAGTVHRDKLDEYTALLEEALLQPAFSEEDFARNKDQLTSYLTNTLQSNDEMLGLEAMQTEALRGPPLRASDCRHGPGAQEHHARRREAVLPRELHPGQPDAGSSPAATRRTTPPGC